MLMTSIPEMTGGMNVANNPMDYLRQLEQMGEQMRQMFGGQDMMKNMFSQMPMFNQQNQPLGSMFGGASGFDWMKSSNSPRADVYETSDHVFVIVELPGLSKREDINVSVEPQRVFIQGTLPNRFGSGKEKAHLQERTTGSFQKEITLPTNVLPDEVQAAYRNGLLEIAIRKDLRNQDEIRGHFVPVDF